MDKIKVEFLLDLEAMRQLIKEHDSRIPTKQDSDVFEGNAATLAEQFTPVEMGKLLIILLADPLVMSRMALGKN